MAKQSRAKKPQPCVVRLTERNISYYLTDKRRESLRKYIALLAEDNPVQEFAGRTAELLGVKVEDLMVAIYLQVHNLACAKNAASDLRHPGVVMLMSDPSLDLGRKIDVMRALMGIAADEVDPQTKKLLGPGKAWQEAVEAKEPTHG